MQYRLIGPFRGGRVLAVAGIPGDPQTYYFGAAAGGVWKSVDGGSHWTPQFDKQDVASIGSIAIAASDPNVVYVGTGEGCLRGDISYGDGVYRSNDAGKTWKNLGLRDTRHIPKVLVDPRNPIRFWWPRRATPSLPTRSAASSAAPMAARPGPKFCMWTTRPGRPTSPSPRAIQHRVCRHVPGAA